MITNIRIQNFKQFEDINLEVAQSVVFIGLDTDLLKMLAAVVVAVFLGIPYLRRVYGPKINKKIKNWKSSKEAKTND